MVYDPNEAEGSAGNSRKLSLSTRKKSYITSRQPEAICCNGGNAKALNGRMSNMQSEGFSWSVKAINRRNTHARVLHARLMYIVQMSWGRIVSTWNGLVNVQYKAQGNGEIYMNNTDYILTDVSDLWCMIGHLCDSSFHCCSTDSTLKCLIVKITYFVNNKFYLVTNAVYGIWSYYEKKILIVSVCIETKVFISVCKYLQWMWCKRALCGRMSKVSLPMEKLLTDLSLALTVLNQSLPSGCVTRPCFWLAGQWLSL